jgi:aminoglycoside phosphotransferase family enzyme/predicted kinase
MTSANLPTLIQRLRDLLQATEVIETHISWVLLAGDSAYKIKKPVNLGFVDFSTLQRRRHFCDEELRLNRRLAPDLYRDVVPISGSPDAPVPGGGPADEPIEFAVLMRKFPQEALATHVLERGGLQAGHIDQLAARIAEFHASCAVAGEETPFGTPESVVAPVEENFRHLERIRSAARPGRGPQIERLRSWSEREFAARRTEFAARRRDGCIRECHGDMHLGNMFLEGDRITIFDCIEFNDSFRWIDVLSEIAFTVMDLEDRGRPDYAHRLLNVYLEATGDYEGLAVLPFYLAYRALVRAKVAALRLDQPGLTVDEHDALQHELDSYLELAERYTQGRPLFLAVTHGVSGSGKTQGTQAVVEQLGALRLRSDVERKRLFGIAPLDRVPAARVAELYSAGMGRQTYARLADLAEAILAAGFPVVVDATFLKRQARDEFRDLAARLRAAFVILDFQAPERILIERLTRRAAAGHDASDASVSVLRQQLKSREPLTGDETLAAITIDSTDPPGAAAVVSGIQSRLAGRSRTA